MWKSLYKFLVVGTGYDVGAQHLSPVVADDLRLQPHGLVALEAILAVDEAVGAVARYDLAVQGLQVAHYLLAFLYRLAEPLLLRNDAREHFGLGIGLHKAVHAELAYLYSVGFLV